MATKIAAHGVAMRDSACLAAIFVTYGAYGPVALFLTAH